MHFDIISLFPEMFTPLTTSGVVAKAYARGVWSMNIHSPRRFAINDYGAVDDRPYGGGPGMVMAYAPLAKTLAAISNPQWVIYLSAGSMPVNQRRIAALAALPSVVLVCGRYEGVDQRFIDLHVDEEVSIGDLIVSGGELPAMCLMEAILRLQPQVLGNQASAQQDSFSEAVGALLEHPHYTRPPTIQAIAAPAARLADTSLAVPPVLLSGDHKKIAAWRREQQQQITCRKRPDLLSEQLVDD